MKSLTATIIAALGLTASAALAADPAELRHKKAPKGYEVITFDALQKQVHDAGSSNQEFSLQAGNEFRFTFLPDGNVVYRPMRALTDLTETSRSYLPAPDLLCIASTGNWSGMCVKVYKNAAGQLYCTGVFGNRAKWKKKCEIGS
ncbi:hypothetical protein [Parasedimentitalea huanghaiensis]|uniref:Uncharacterized protein n=1 Tax=Parasedimentitalea huanghaiensis TaxID=2682100 RepID=A0A6L6WN34_9RHOB|nr:hypothetical protein [Zongyanglinia huanghaiensis]MVO17032.1 hypothetical protein [Zongyanglinia huanghaiensis]